MIHTAIHSFGGAEAKHTRVPQPVVHALATPNSAGRRPERPQLLGHAPTLLQADGLLACHPAWKRALPASGCVPKASSSRNWP